MSKNYRLIKSNKEFSPVDVSGIFSDKQVPDAYIELLEIVNGIVLYNLLPAVNYSTRYGDDSTLVTALYGINVEDADYDLVSVRQRLLELSEDIELDTDRYFPVGEDEAGNLLVIPYQDTGDCPVFLYHYETGDTYLISKSLRDFISPLVEQVREDTTSNHGT
ncbi:MAG: SMI1/KNR4 family protein [Candidatus Dojkabacteria bacterium]